MEVSNVLKKHIVTEFLALTVLVGCICYAALSINGSNSKVTTVNGLVAVLDDSKVGKIAVSSDGQGMDENGYVYAVTNNNSTVTKYKIVVYVNNHDDKVLKNVKLTPNGFSVKNLSDYDRYNGGYVISEYILEPGFTKRHFVKAWYQVDTPSDSVDVNLKFKFDIVS